MNLIVPKRLIKKDEIMPGIGLKEIGIASIGIVGAVAVFMIFSFLPAPLRLFFTALVGFSGVVIIIPLSYDENAIVLFKRYKKYKARDKTFYYKRYTR